MILWTGHKITKNCNAENIKSITHQSNPDEWTGKGKLPCSTAEHRWSVHFPAIGHWAHRWIYHWVYDARRTASAKPDLQSPSQPQSITALWMVPIYAAWWHGHMCVNNLPRVITWKWNGCESNPWPVFLNSWKVVWDSVVTTDNSKAIRIVFYALQYIHIMSYVHVLNVNRISHGASVLLLLGPAKMP